MERFKDLNRYQKILLVVMAAMILVFGILYGIASGRLGIRFKDGFLVYSEDNRNAIYSGSIRGQTYYITVTPEKSVTFQCDDRMYDPYTFREDHSAIPADHDWANMMTGIEIREGDEILFRGGAMKWNVADNEWMLVDEEGNSNLITITYTMSDGTEVDSEGNVIDPMKPSVTAIWELMNEPELEKRVQWTAWFGGLFLCLMNAIYMLFAEDLFRFGLSFRIRYADDAEPSDWQITQWYIGWTAIAVMALVLFILGLQ